MSKNILNEVSNFIKTNNNYSDLNIVDNLLLNLNFTKYRFNNKQFGGFYGNPNGNPIDIKNNIMNELETSGVSHDIATKVVNEASLEANMNGYMNGNNEANMNGNNSNILGNDSQLVENNILNEFESKGIDHTVALKAVDEAINDVNNQRKKDNNQQQMGNNQQQMNPYELESKLFNNTFLQKPDFVTNEIKTYTIPKGTLLYYGVNNKRGFNPDNIDFGDNELISIFTPNFSLASDRIGGCDINNQKSYIHVFVVKQDIPNIYIKLPYDTNEDISLYSLYKQFCSGSKQYNGVGFFYHKNELEQFSKVILNPTNQMINQNNDLFNSEFGLCNPTPYLAYVNTHKCQGLRQLSKEYRMDGKN